MRKSLSDSELESVTGGNQIAIQIDAPTDRHLQALPPKTFRKPDNEPSVMSDQHVWKSTYVKGDPGTGTEYKFEFDSSLLQIERDT